MDEADPHPGMFCAGAPTEPGACCARATEFVTIEGEFVPQEPDVWIGGRVVLTLAGRKLTGIIVRGEDGEYVVKLDGAKGADDA